MVKKFKYDDGTLYQIEWFDAQTKPGWVDMNQLTEATTCLCHTYGFIVAETPKAITVINTFGWHDGVPDNAPSFVGCFTIPHDWVQKITKIKKMYSHDRLKAGKFGA